MKITFYFFNAKIYFNNKFYFNKFICLFLLQELIKFVGFKTPIVERWLIFMKRLVAAPVLLVLSRVSFQIEVVRKSLGG